LLEVRDLGGEAQLEGEDVQLGAHARHGHHLQKELLALSQRLFRARVASPQQQST
jgi:hypothetical protein